MFTAKQRGQQTTEYRDLLESFGVTHEDVLYWLGADKINHRTEEFEGAQK